MENKNQSALAIAEAYHKSWVNKNYEKAANYLADSIKFEMPINSYNSKREFIEALTFTGNAATDINLLTELGNETDAVLIYDFNFEPIGTMRVAEHFKVENGKIILIRHIHDTFQLKKSGFGQKS
jgi:hypothetical protein